MGAPWDAGFVSFLTDRRRNLVTPRGGPRLGEQVCEGRLQAPSGSGIVDVTCPPKAGPGAMLETGPIFGEQTTGYRSAAFGRPVKVDSLV